MNIRSTLVCLGLLATVHAGATLAAQRPSGTSSQAQSRSPYLSPRTSERQIQQIVTRLRADAETLRQSMDTAAPRGRAYGNRARQNSTEISYLIDDLLQTADHLNDHVVRQQVIRADLDDLLHRGVLIERALPATPTPNSQTAWSHVRRDLDQLATGYGMSSNWHERDYSQAGDGVDPYQRLTGTYHLDPSRSDNSRQVADRALAQVSGAQRTRIANQVYARIEAPEVLSIDRTGRRVTIASSRAPQVTFDADGQPRAEPTYGGRTTTTRASVYGDRLEVNSSGGIGTDYSATFEPLDGGQSLRLTNQIYDEDLRQPIVVRSVYRRTSDVPEWNVHDARANDRAVPRGTPAIVPDGTILVATLDNEVTTGSRQNDRVTFTVKTAPRRELEGAVIQGVLAGAPSQQNGRTGVPINFYQIRLRDGRAADFEGVVTNVRGTAGNPVGFDPGEQAPDRQRDEVIQRGAIGASVGAIIGAVVGGGKGAAIGALIGGGGGIATVFLGRDQNSLPRGTEFTIRARAPYQRP